MSFGWSPSDIVTVANLCYEIYSFCQRAPAELQGLKARLERMEGKLRQFSAVLEKSGLGSWKQAPTLKQHLLDAKEYLEPLQSVSNETTSASKKAKGLVRLAWTRDKLKRIEENLDIDDKEIHDMKIDLILMCSLRNLLDGNNMQPNTFDSLAAPRHRNETINLLNDIQPSLLMPSAIPLKLENDRDSIKSVALSNASKALVVAMGLTCQPSRDTHVACLGEITPTRSLKNVQTTKEFIADVVSLAEVSELYYKDTDPLQNLEQLANLTERATNFHQALLQSSGDLRPGSLTTRHQVALAGESSSGPPDPSALGYSPLIDANASTQMGVFRDNQTKLSGSYYSATGYPNSLMGSSGVTSLGGIPSQQHSGNEDGISEMDTASSNSKLSTQNFISLRRRSEFSLTKDLKQRMICSFQMEVSEGSVVLKVTPNTRSNSTSDAMPAFGALPRASGNSSGRAQSMSHSIRTQFPRLFQHYFQSQARPIPHLLHPEDEGPEQSDAPYTISFTQPQHISVEGAPEGPRWTTFLTYIFHNERDRITLCEKIFGKTLVMSAGSNRIIYDGHEISHMSAITLWVDDASGIKSITFSNNTRRRAMPKDVELSVYGLWNTKQPSRKSATLNIIAALLPRVDERLGRFSKPGRQSSILGSSSLSRSSTVALQKQSKSVKLRCTIDFTGLSDKEMLLSHLI